MKVFLTNFLLPLLVAASAGLVALAFYEVLLFLEIALVLLVALGAACIFGAGWSLSNIVFTYKLKAALPETQDAIERTSARLGIPWWCFGAVLVAMIVIGTGGFIVGHKIEKMEEEVEAKKAVVEKLEAQNGAAR